jgi:para-aminobenzoate synthetase component 1
VLKRLEERPSQRLDRFRLEREFFSNMSREYYVKAFERIQNYLLSGDCYQVNLAQRFSAPYSGSGWLAYRHLRECVPAPWSAYLGIDDSAILCFSPERFLSVNSGVVETKPIKGTRPRGNCQRTDLALKNELLDSQKDQAENLMIVDLLRNDLSKNCTCGTVEVDQLFAVESFSNVHHLVSTIHGRLRSDKTILDLLRGCFPGGSITGAPKRRAMEIIDELEPDNRQIYCGSIFYINFNGDMDSNVAIRTLLCDSGNIHCWGGGGVVADSTADSEYQESLDKIQVFLNELQKYFLA